MCVYETDRQTDRQRGPFCVPGTALGPRLCIMLNFLFSNICLPLISVTLLKINSTSQASLKSSSLRPKNSLFGQFVSCLWALSSLGESEALVLDCKLGWKPPGSQAGAMCSLPVVSLKPCGIEGWGGGRRTLSSLEDSSLGVFQGTSSFWGFFL